MDPSKFSNVNINKYSSDREIEPIKIGLQKEPYKLLKIHSAVDEINKQQKLPWPKLRPSIDFIPNSKLDFINEKIEFRRISEKMSKSTDLFNTKDDNQEISPIKKIESPKIFTPTNTSNKKVSFFSKPNITIKNDVKYSNAIKAHEMTSVKTPLSNIEINYYTKQPLKRESEKKQMKKESNAKAKVNNISNIKTQPSVNNDSNVISAVNKHYLKKKNVNPKEQTKSDIKLIKSASCLAINPSNRTLKYSESNPRVGKLHSQKNIENEIVHKDDGLSMAVSNLIYGVRYDLINKSPEIEYKITMKFKLKNCYIKDSMGNELKIIVQPKNRQTV